MSSLAGAALLVGRAGAGYLLDRVFAPRLAVVCFGAASIGMGLLWAGVTGPSTLLAVFLIGVGMGAQVDIIAYLMGRYFGLFALGTAFGVSFACYLLAAAAGVLFMGVVFDATNNYTLPLAACSAAMIMATGLMARLGPYRYAPIPSESSV